MTQSPPAGTQAVGRALGILNSLARSQGELTIKAIAEGLGLSAGTTNRIVRALMVDGLVAQNPQTDAYYLGSGTVLLGQSAQRNFGIDRMIPYLEQLNAETEESVNLAVREGGESVVMVRVQSTLPLRFVQHPGARFPLYATASGKSILAFSDSAPEYVHSLPEILPQITAHTLKTPAALSETLKETRRRGYSIDEQENVDGVRCVGAPVIDWTGQAQAAIVVQGPSVRMSESRIGELGRRTMDIAEDAARFLPMNHSLSR